MGALADLISPLRCAACGIGADGDLCASCAMDVEPLRAPLCERCGTPGALTNPAACASCGGLEGFRRARSLVAYGGPASRLVLALKRHGRPGLAAAAGGLMAELARAQHLLASVVTFVPGGRSARSLGYDHAELLARHVAAGLGVPCRALLSRALEGPRQADVPLYERRMNVRGRFRALPCSGSVLVVDDVFTTGATAEACALALLEAGADGVDVITFARTRRRSHPHPG